MRILILGAIVFVSVIGTAWGQDVRIDERPAIYKPKTPPTRQEQDRRESLRKYVDGLLYEREDRYQDALKAFEDAARLDPKSPAAFKAQVPILAAMLRVSDALEACGKVVALDPGDYQIWYAQAKLLRRLGKYPEATAVLERAVKCEAAHDHPEAAQQIYFELGDLHEYASKFGPAADAYNKAAEILEHPDLIMKKGPFPREAILARAAETYEKISQLYRKEKQYDKALDALKKAQTRSPDRADRINYHLAELCDEKGALKEGMVFLDAFLRTQPLSLEPYELKLSFLRRLQQDGAILPWLEAVAERDKNNAGLQRLLAKEYASAKQLTKAEELYKKLADDAPNAEIYRGLFQIYKLEGAAGMARILVMLDKVIDKAAGDNGPPPLGAIQHGRAMVGALRADGELARPLVEIAFRRMDNANAELKIDTLRFLAELADKHRKNDEAERFYRRCLADKTASPANEAALYGGLLRALARAKKYEAIVAVCKQGTQTAKATNPLLFYSEMARAQAGLHLYDEALRTADLGKEKGPDRKLLFQIQRVRIQIMAERHAAAEKECLALLDVHKQPDDVLELRYLLSNVYSASKQHAKSEEQLQLILKIDPFNATANNDLGYQWADQGKNLEVAEDMIRKAIDLDRAQRHKSTSADADKDNAAYIDSLGWVLFRKGDLKGARAELEKAVALPDGDDDPVVWDHLADVLFRLGEKDKAAATWRKALTLFDGGNRPKDERYQEIQQKLRQTAP
jgi:tetratricopeptide (TPR) repeat protein